jgi:hypothetical protein
MAIKKEDLEKIKEKLHQVEKVCEGAFAELKQDLVTL